MSKKMTTEEKKANIAAHDTLIKDVFDNFRNLFLCVTLALSGGAVLKLPPEVSFGSSFNIAIAVLVMIVALMLYF